jgi:hypothetical protein
MLHARRVNTDEIKDALNEVFDQAIVFHGFTDYMRDYEGIVYATADPRTGTVPKHLRYTFKLCVRATVASAVPPEVWARSLDERLTDYESGVDLDGYVWGVKWQAIYPGIQLVDPSPDAERWAEALGLSFHEVSIETNGHNINLVFSDLSVESATAGYTPFSVPESGPDWKIPLP